MSVRDLAAPDARVMRLSLPLDERAQGEPDLG